MLSGVISYPVPPYSNVPIQPQFYQPSRFAISGITLGQNTVVTTSTDHDYVIGQQIRLLIPGIYGTYQLNGIQGIVLDVPSSTSVLVNIDSTQANAFIPTPYSSIITNLTVLDPTHVMITSINYFTRGNPIFFSNVNGTTEINLRTGMITSISPTAFTVEMDTTLFSSYISGGIATLYVFPQPQAQIIAIGDINSGIISSTGTVNSSTNIPGSFINISPI